MTPAPAATVTMSLFALLFTVAAPLATPRRGRLPVSGGSLCPSIGLFLGCCWGSSHPRRARRKNFPCQDEALSVGERPRSRPQ